MPAVLDPDTLLAEIGLTPAPAKPEARPLLDPDALLAEIGLFPAEKSAMGLAPGREHIPGPAPDAPSPSDPGIATSPPPDKPWSAPSRPPLPQVLAKIDDSMHRLKAADRLKTPEQIDAEIQAGINGEPPPPPVDMAAEAQARVDARLKSMLGAVTDDDANRELVEAVGKGEDPRGFIEKANQKWQQITGIRPESELPPGSPGEIRRHTPVRDYLGRTPMAEPLVNPLKEPGKALRRAGQALLGPLGWLLPEKGKPDFAVAHATSTINGVREINRALESGELDAEAGAALKQRRQEMMDSLPSGIRKVSLVEGDHSVNDFARRSARIILNTWSLGAMGNVNPSGPVRDIEAAVQSLDMPKTAAGVDIVSTIAGYGSMPAMPKLPGSKVGAKVAARLADKMGYEPIGAALKGGAGDAIKGVALKTLERAIGASINFPLLSSVHKATRGEAISQDELVEAAKQGAIYGGVMGLLEGTLDIIEMKGFRNAAHRVAGDAQSPQEVATKITKAYQAKAKVDAFNAKIEKAVKSGELSPAEAAEMRNFASANLSPADATLLDDIMAMRNFLAKQPKPTVTKMPHAERGSGETAVATVPTPAPASSPVQPAPAAAPAPAQPDLAPPPEPGAARAGTSLPKAKGAVQPMLGEGTGIPPSAVQTAIDQVAAAGTTTNIPGQIELDGAQVHLNAKGDTLELSTIQALKPGSGKGSEALRTVLDAAEAAGVPVVVEPRKIAGTSVSALREWYKRHGFEEDPANKGRMVRKALDENVGFHGTIAENAENMLQNGYKTTGRYNKNEIQGLFTGPQDFVRRRYGDGVIAVVPKSGAKIIGLDELIRKYGDTVGRGKEVTEQLRRDGWDAVRTAPHKLVWVNPEMAELKRAEEMGQASKMSRQEAETLPPPAAKTAPPAEPAERDPALTGDPFGDDVFAKYKIDTVSEGEVARQQAEIAARTEDLGAADLPVGSVVKLADEDFTVVGNDERGVRLRGEDGRAQTVLPGGGLLIDKGSYRSPVEAASVARLTEAEAETALGDLKKEAASTFKRDLGEMSLSTDHEKVSQVEDIAGLFGGRGMVFKAEHGAALPFEGARWTLKGGKPVLAVWEGTDKLATGLAVHEGVHQFRINHPELWDDLSGAIRSELDQGKYDAWVSDQLKDDQVAAARASQGVEHDFWEEFVARLVESRGNRPQFWQSLARKVPEALKKLREALRRIIRRLRASLLGRKHHRSEVEKAIKDIRKVDQAIVDALAAAMQREVTGLRKVGGPAPLPQAMGFRGDAKFAETKPKQGEGHEDLPGAKGRTRTLAEVGQTLARHAERRYPDGTTVPAESRVRREGRLHAWLRGLAGRSPLDREVWRGVGYSDRLAADAKFAVAADAFAALGYEAVPITGLAGGRGGMVDTETKTAFLAENDPELFAGYVAHEMLHVMARRGDASVLALRDAVDLGTRQARMLRSALHYNGDKLREEIAAAIVSGRTDLLPTLKDMSAARPAQDAVMAAMAAEPQTMKFGGDAKFAGRPMRAEDKARTVVSPQQNKEYIEAVNKGDFELAGKLRQEAHKRLHDIIMQARASRSEYLLTVFNKEMEKAGAQIGRINSPQALESSPEDDRPTTFWLSNIALVESMGDGKYGVFFKFLPSPYNETNMPFGAGMDPLFDRREWDQLEKYSEAIHWFQHKHPKGSVSFNQGNGFIVNGNNPVSAIKKAAVSLREAYAQMKTEEAAVPVPFPSYDTYAFFIEKPPVEYDAANELIPLSVLYNQPTAQDFGIGTDKMKFAGRETAKPEKAGVAGAAESANRAVEEAVRKKYAGLFALPEAWEFNALPESISGPLETNELAPGDLAKYLADVPAEQVAEAVREVRLALADKMGDLVKTYRYEGQADGEGYERYLDRILRVARKAERRIPGGVVPDPAAPAAAPAGEARQVPGRPGVETDAYGNLQGGYHDRARTETEDGADPVAGAGPADEGRTLQPDLRVRHQRQLDAQVRGAGEANAARWTGVAVSEPFARSLAFARLSSGIARNLGAGTVPITSVRWNGCCNHATRTIFIGENTDAGLLDEVAKHEASHLLDADGNADIHRLRALVDPESPAYKAVYDELMTNPDAAATYRAAALDALGLDHAAKLMPSQAKAVAEGIRYNIYSELIAAFNNGRPDLAAAFRDQAVAAEIRRRLRRGVLNFRNVPKARHGDIAPAKPEAFIPTPRSGDLGLGDDPNYFQLVAESADLSAPDRARKKQADQAAAEKFNRENQLEFKFAGRHVAPRVTSEEDARYLELAQDEKANAVELRKMVSKAALRLPNVAKIMAVEQSGVYWRVQHSKEKLPDRSRYLWSTAEGDDEYYPPGHVSFYANLSNAVRDFAGKQGDAWGNVSQQIIEEGKDVPALVAATTKYETKDAPESEVILIHPHEILRIIPSASDIEALLVLTEVSDPVTRDDAGNVIPLSQRFDAKQSDIRYSDLKPTGAGHEDVQGADGGVRTLEEIGQAIAALGMRAHAQREPVLHSARIRRKREFNAQAARNHAAGAEDARIWKDARYSKSLERTEHFKAIAALFDRIGYVAVPITRLEDGRGGMANSAHKVVFLAEGSPGDVLHFAAHEAGHVARAAGNEAFARLVASVDLDSPMAKMWAETLGYGGDQLAEEIAASIVGGMTENLDALRPGAASVARQAQESVISGLEKGNLATNKSASGKPSYGRISPALAEYYKKKDAWKRENNPLWYHLTKGAGLRPDNIPKVELESIPKALLAKRGQGMKPDLWYEDADPDVVAQVMTLAKQNGLDVQSPKEVTGNDFAGLIANLQSPEQAWREHQAEDQAMSAEIAADIEFQLQNDAGKKKLVYVADLKIGDKFMAGGTPVVVEDTEQGEIVIRPLSGDNAPMRLTEDGLTLPGGQVIQAVYADRGTFSRQDDLDSEAVRSLKAESERLKKELDATRSELRKTEDVSKERLAKLDAATRAAEKQAARIQNEVEATEAKGETVADPALKAQLDKALAEIERTKALRRRLKETGGKAVATMSHMVSTPIERLSTPKADHRFKNPVLAEFAAGPTRAIEAKRKKYLGATVKPGEIVDIRLAMTELQEITGEPFSDIERQLFAQDRQNDFDSKEDVVDFFKDTAWKHSNDFVNTKSEHRVTYWIGTGGKVPEGQQPLTADELKVAERIMGTLRVWEHLTKNLRMMRFINTGQFDKGQERYSDTYLEGQRIFEEKGKEALEEWLEDQNFGVREHYLPFIHQHLKNKKVVHALRFGRGFSQTRDTLENVPPGWEKDYPLIGSVYRYIRRARNIETIEPLAREMDKLFEDYKGPVELDRGIIHRYLDNMLGIREPTDVITEWIRYRGVGHFFRVAIPQNIPRWVLRNLIQPSVTTVPLSVNPLDTASMKHLHEAYLSAITRWRDASPELKKYFLKNVAGLDVVKQEYLMQEMTKWEGKGGEGLRVLMRLYDQLGAAYSFSDYINRINSFFPAHGMSKDAIARWRKTPTLGNANRIPTASGFVNAPHTDWLRLGRLLDEGRDEDAARMIGQSMSDVTQFMYDRKQKGLAFMGFGKGADVIAPIATFWKGHGQMVLTRGVTPLWEAAQELKRNPGNPDPYLIRRGVHAAKFMASWYAMSLLGNLLLWLAYDRRDASYGWQALYFIPGGPVIDTIGRFIKSVKYVTEGEKGADAQLARALDAAGYMFVPFWNTFNRFVGSIKDQERYSWLLDAHRAIKDAYLKQTGQKAMPDTRKWTDRDWIQKIQYVAFGGSHSMPSAELARKFGEYLDATDPAKKAAIAAEIERELRKYPVSSNRKDEPRTVENIGAIIPELDPGSIKRLAETWQSYQRTRNPLHKEKLRKQIEAKLERWPARPDLPRKIENIYEIIPELRQGPDLVRQLRIERKRALIERRRRERAELEALDM